MCLLLASIWLQDLLVLAAAQQLQLLFFYRSCESGMRCCLIADQNTQTASGHRLIKQKSGNGLSVSQVQPSLQLYVLSPRLYKLAPPPPNPPPPTRLPAITHAFKAPVVWPFLNNIIGFITHVCCITSESDIIHVCLHRSKPIYAKWRHGDCYINFALKHALCTVTTSTQKKSNATCSPDSPCRTDLAISIWK